MTTLLLKLLSRNSETREGYGLAAGLFGIISNALISILKLIVGLLAGSIAIIADGVNNLSDCVSSIITMVGFHLSKKPADKEHPYGHARMEYIAGLVVSFIVIFIGLQLIGESITKIKAPTFSSFGNLSIAVMLFSILIKLWQVYLFRMVGRQLNSSALMATAIDSRNDIISSIAILISIPLSSIVGFSLDGYIGLAVSLFIIYSGIILVKETSAPLLGSAPDNSTMDIISSLILETEGVLGLHDLIIHSYGEGRVFASAHVEMSADGDLLKSHEIIDGIEFKVHELLDINLTLHLDPVVNDDRVLELKNKVEELIYKESPQLKFHDFRAVFTPDNVKIVFDLTLPPNLNLSASELRSSLTRKITEEIENSTAVIIIESHFTDLHR